MKLFHKTKKRLREVFKSAQKLLENLIHLKETKKTKAIAFVDYEHWYYSYQNMYHIKPDIIGWRKELEKKHNLDDVMVFANFSHKGIREELTKIRCITNSIIETQQIIANFAKDMTDFIMLDYIYQYVNEHPDTDTYIIVTGDAHFQSVVKYLIQKHGKKVVVYGVKNAFSSQLKQIASETVELPTSEEVIRGVYPLIVDNMAYVSDKYTIVPTFSSTARTLSERYNVPEKLVRAALNEMLEKGLLYTRKRAVRFNQTVTVLAANWDALAKEGLWSYWLKSEAT